MNIQEFYQQLDRLFQTGQIDQVEPFLLKQLTIVNQEHHWEGSLAILNELIGFYRSQKRYEEALRVSQQALDLCRLNGITDSLSYATTLLNAATAYRFAGQADQALDYFRQAENLYSQKISLLDGRFASLYNNMSAVLADKGEYDKSAEYLLRAVAIMEALPGEEIHAAISHANLASLYAKLQNWHGAKEHIAAACALLQNRPEARAQYEEYCALQKLFEQNPG